MTCFTVRLIASVTGPSEVEAEGGWTLGYRSRDTWLGWIANADVAETVSVPPTCMHAQLH